LNEVPPLEHSANAARKVFSGTLPSLAARVAANAGANNCSPTSSAAASNFMTENHLFGANPPNSEEVRAKDSAFPNP